MVSGRIRVDHQFYVLAVGGTGMYSVPLTAQPGSSGVVTVFEQEGVLLAHPGTFMGPVALDVEVLGAEPAVVTDGWDEIVEVSLRSPDVDEQLDFTNASGNSAEGVDPLPALEGGLAYRLRVHMRGRDAAYAATVGGSLGEPIEQHLYLAWAAPPSPEKWIKLTDRFGQHIRQWLVEQAAALATASAVRGDEVHDDVAGVAAHPQRGDGLAMSAGSGGSSASEPVIDHD